MNSINTIWLLGVVGVLILAVSDGHAAQYKQSKEIHALLTGRPSEAVAALEVAASGEDAVASAYLANVYYYGWGVPIDFSRSHKYAQNAAQKGVGAATLMLSIEFKQEIESSRLNDAKKSANKLAKRGDALSQYYVAKVSENEVGAGKIFSALILEPTVAGATGQHYDPNKPIRDANHLSAKSRKYYQEAADAGFAPAMQTLGILYSDGRGYEKDTAEMFRWFGAAADKELAGSQYVLGATYVTGKGAPQDLERGVPLVEEAAAKNHAAATNLMGTLLRDGIGVSQDLNAASRMFQVAASNGNTDAKNNLDALNVILAEQQQEAALQDELMALRRNNLELFTFAEQAAEFSLWLSWASSCLPHEINSGAELIRTPYMTAPDSAYETEEAKWKYFMCISGLSAIPTHVIFIIDFDKVKADGLLPLVTKEIDTKLDDLCNQAYSLPDQVRLNFTPDEVVERSRRCVPFVLEQIEKVMPYKLPDEEIVAIIAEQKAKAESYASREIATAEQVSHRQEPVAAEDEDKRIRAHLLGEKGSADCSSRPKSYALEILKDFETLVYSKPYNECSSLAYNQVKQYREYYDASSDFFAYQSDDIVWCDIAAGVRTNHNAFRETARYCR